MQLTVGEIAAMINGVVEGDEHAIIRRPNTIEEAQNGEISFLADMRYEKYLYTTKSSAVLVGEDFQAKQDVPTTLIRVKDIRKTLHALQQHFNQNNDKKKGISPNASVDSSVFIPEDSYVGDFAVVSNQCTIGKRVQIHGQVYLGEGCIVGNDTILYPGVRCYPNSIIGKHCIIHSNTVIGSDGFGFVPDENGQLSKVPHSGNVIIEDEVEIGANCTIDRGSMGSTIIGQGTKLDNLIQIAHNVKIGRNTVIAAQAGVAGSSSIGDHCMIGGQAGFAGHISVGNFVKVQAQSGINRNLQDNTSVYGSPALEYYNYLKSYAVFKNLPELNHRLRQLEAELKENK
jgi:UDP-3-O-[3-hydroxymyristoyl] glucosamine N-acyltransferase